MKSSIFLLSYPGAVKTRSVLLTVLCLSLIQPAISTEKTSFLEGKSLFQAKNYKDALAYLDKSVDEDPTNGEFHYWRGKCLASLGKGKEAAAEFKLAALFAGDSKLKDDCRKELARFNLSLPAGSVNDSKTAIASKSNSEALPANEDKLFKLSSKKLDWNLEMRKDFLDSISAKNAQLEKLARSGGRWTASTSRSSGSRVLDLRAALQDGPAHSIVPLSADERKSLCASDIFIILDHSGSMSTADCPSSQGLQSRISWCREELLAFADDLVRYLPHGFHLITFDSKPEIFHITSSQQLLDALNGLEPGGGTNLAGALNEAFRLHTSHPQQPLLGAILSDAEIEVRSSEQAIVDASRRFHLPNGVFLTLLQVGLIAEIHSENTLKQLDNLDKNAGAAYDPFEGISFSKLRKDGLSRDLLSGLRVNAETASGPQQGKKASDDKSIAKGKKL